MAVAPSHNSEPPEIPGRFNLLEFTGITGFSTAQDILNAASVVGDDTIITLSANDSITLIGFAGLTLSDASVV